MERFALNVAQEIDATNHLLLNIYILLVARCIGSRVWSDLTSSHLGDCEARQGCFLLNMHPHTHSLEEAEAESVTTNMLSGVVEILLQHHDGTGGQAEVPAGWYD